MWRNSASCFAEHSLIVLSSCKPCVSAKRRMRGTFNPGAEALKSIYRRCDGTPDSDTWRERPKSTPFEAIFYAFHQDRCFVPLCDRANAPDLFREKYSPLIIANGEGKADQPFSGDQAGSEAPVAVRIGRSLKPVMSIVPMPDANPAPPAPEAL